jgi:putative DNA primase/helicase
MTSVASHANDLQQFLKYAQFYVERGWRLIPLYGITEEGTCECPEGPKCPRPGKHPRVEKWQERATTDLQEVRRWLTQWPRTNIGILTGSPSGIVVVDVDRGDPGPSNLPPTARVKTRRGYHFYFLCPKGVEEIRTTKLPGGVDIKAEGGYVVAPPSRYPGGQYQWVGELELAPFPLELLEQVKRSQRVEVPVEGGIVRIPEGCRNDHLTSIAGYLRNRNDIDADDIRAFLQLYNKRHCDPPLEEEEVDRIAAGILRYPTQFDCTPVGNARRLVYWHKRDIRYVREVKEWYVWDGKRWTKDNGVELQMRAKSVVETIAAEAAAETDSRRRSELRTWHKRSQSKRIIDDMIALAASEPEVLTSIEEFDQNPWLLNVENGTLDLRTMEFREHRREDMLTQMSRVRYDPQARAPKWEQFLERVLPDPEVRAFVQRAVGYTLTGVTSEQVLFMLLGTGSNGKTTFLEVIRYILGEYAAQTGFDTFTPRERSGDPRNDLARLRGARLVTASEPRVGEWFDESLIKSLTGGEPVHARFLYRDYFEYKPQFKIWITANNGPWIRELSAAVWRRILVVEFPVTIPEEERNPNLVEELKAEAPGILNWALEGLKEWMAQGLNPPEEVRAATADYLEGEEDTDTIARFIEKWCDFSDPEAFTSTEELYQRYCRTTGENSFKMARKTFYARARSILLRRKARPDREVTPEGRKLRGYRGVKLRGEHEVLLKLSPSGGVWGKEPA